VNRQELEAKLGALNANMERNGLKPLFTAEAAAAMSDEGVKKAVKLTEEDLLRSTGRIVEQ
jgi:hypothetical protein